VASEAAPAVEELLNAVVTSGPAWDVDIPGETADAEEDFATNAAGAEMVKTSAASDFVATALPCDSEDAAAPPAG
jgi:hypothetical protein